MSESDALSDTPDQVLALLDDPGAQSILSITASGPYSVSELVARCDLSTATVYRKVNALVDTGLLEKRIRIRSRGRNASEYVLQQGRITIPVLDEDSIAIDCTIEIRAQSTDQLPWINGAIERQASTDGGRNSRTEKDTTDRQHLASLFIDVTGTDELVDRQDIPVRNRLVDDESRSISEYVQTAAGDDGLAEAIDESNPSQIP